MTMKKKIWILEVYEKKQACVKPACVHIFAQYYAKPS